VHVDYVFSIDFFAEHLETLDEHVVVQVVLGPVVHKNVD